MFRGVIDLSPDDYRETGAVLRPTRRGLSKLAYFARHPILAFVTYQKAYPDEDDSFKERQANAIFFGIGMFIIHKLQNG